jgi:predicted RNase H-like nuclease (RuvC/YqgF family)
VGLSEISGAAEIVGAATLFLMLVYRQVKTGTRDGWRDAAESQEARANALETQVKTLVDEVRALRIENEALRMEVAELRIENRELRLHIDTLLNRGTDDPSH